MGIRVNHLALLEGGERKRNLTTTDLGPVPTRSSQSPLRIRSVQVEGVKELGSDKVTSHEVPMAIQGETARRWQTNVVRDLENKVQPDSPVEETCSPCRAWPVESLVDSSWQSFVKFVVVPKVLA